MRLTAALALSLVISCGVSCGGEAGPQPAVPASPAPQVAAPPSAGTPPTSGANDPWALPPKPAPSAPKPVAGPIALAPWKKAAAAKGIAAPSALCAAYGKRAPAKTRGNLREAVTETDPAKRDALLVALLPHDPDPEFPRIDLVQALRADLAPIECADAIADPYLATRSSVDGEYQHLLVGLSLASKLARTAKSPPAMTGPDDKAKVAAFVKGPLKTWMVEQATAIELLGSGAVGLVGYARGVAAIEAGNADLRLVDNMRSAPVPKEWDPELKQVYEVVLDEALEPRKTRGRDAALVGLADLGEIGSLQDARVTRARTILSKLYGGRRIDALDVLLPAPPAGPRREPVSDFWLGVPELAALGASPASASRSLDRGRAYWRRSRFVDAAYLAKEGKSPEDRLLLALSLALAHGPANANEMMRAPTPAALDLAHTEALDALVAEGGANAGAAAFDAAYLRWLCPPEGDAAAPHLRDVAARFRKAESLLGGAQKKLASDRAADADAAAAASAGTKP